MTVGTTSGEGIADWPTALLFDWDNTLVDSWGTIHDAVNTTLSAMGLPAWTMTETRERVRQSLRDSFPRMFGDRWPEARRIYLEAFEAIHLQRLTPLPGATELVADLAEAGFYLGLVSNKTGRLLRREVEVLGWSALFGRVIGAGDAPADKPDPAPVDLALGDSGITRGAQVWFVGDTGIDMACARNAGCVGVLIHPAVPVLTPGEFDDAPPALAFTDCAALGRYLLARH
ncbi:MAG TPA: HAD family hydrolase [Stellaceae bacterium]|nr:HAD family hydrolase [Stellaceae bacterium]